MSRRRPPKKKDGNDQIVIDQKKGLIFDSEDELYAHFNKEIGFLEKDFFKLREDSDILEDDFGKHEDNLTQLLEDPDEVWLDKETMPGVDFSIYLKKIGRPRIRVKKSKKKQLSEAVEGAAIVTGDDEPEEDKPLYHVAVVYIADDAPSFVYLHFPTQSQALYGQYRRGTKIFDKFDQETPPGALEGDALSENDDFAKGLYLAMLKVRSESDIREEDFRDFGHLREETIEEPDEIWRSTDTLGNVLVHFVRDLTEEQSLYYIVVTIEDQPSNSHALLFSFPTNDDSLVARYRHGENLQAEEVVQEASH